MVLRDHDVELTRPRGHKHRVAGPRAAGVDALAPGIFDRGQDFSRVFVAEQPAFARVRVEPRDRDPRFGDPNGLRTLLRMADGAQHGRAGDQRHSPAQRHVDGGQHRADVIVGKHHSDLLGGGAAEVGQHLGVAGVGHLCC